MTPGERIASGAGLLRTSVPGLPLEVRGKVRDVYGVGEALLIVATDRLSAFDVVFEEPIPDKGRVLQALSAHWFDRLASIVPNHVLGDPLELVPEIVGDAADQIAGRSMLVRRLSMFPVECVARGYLSGSGWKEYRERGSVCGIELPRGLRESDRLPSPIFTPATKARTGHDENVSFDRVVGLVGGETAERLRHLTLELYGRGAAEAERRGIIVADTKFEFGRDRDGVLRLGDEALTPDSSRFWPLTEYRPGGPQPSFDKQFVRDHLESIGWSKTPPPPRLPPAVVEGTRQRYLEIHRILTGRELP